MGRWEDRGQGGSGVCGRPEGQVQGLVDSAVSTGPQGFVDRGAVECEGGPSTRSFLSPGSTKTCPVVEGDTAWLGLVCGYVSVTFPVPLPSSFVLYQRGQGHFPFLPAGSDGGWGAGGVPHASAPPSSPARRVPSWEPLTVSLGLLPGLEALRLVLFPLLSFPPTSVQRDLLEDFDEVMSRSAPPVLVGSRVVVVAWASGFVTRACRLRDKCR